MLARHFDWETFRATPLTFTTEHLSLCSKFGVDPYTLELSKILRYQFCIPTSGKQNISHPLSPTSLAPLTPPNQPNKSKRILTLIHTLASSDSGLAFLGICSILGNYYPLESIIKVFQCLVVESTVPEDLKPMVEGWESLTPLSEAFQGPGRFGEMVDRFIALGDLDADEIERRRIGRRELQHGSVFSVVASLSSMSRLEKRSVYGSDGEEKGEEGKGERNKIPWLPDVTSCAGWDAGWQAAVAEWLFGLEFELRGRLPSEVSEESLKGEKILWTNCGVGEKVVLCVRFNPPGIPVNGEVVEEVPLTVKNRKAGWFGGDA